jgi:hypothetical protein
MDRTIKHGFAVVRAVLNQLVEVRYGLLRLPVVQLRHPLVEEGIIVHLVEVEGLQECSNGLLVLLVVEVDLTLLEVLLALNQLTIRDCLLLQGSVGLLAQPGAYGRAIIVDPTPRHQHGPVCIGPPLLLGRSKFLPLRALLVRVLRETSDM